MSYDCVIGIDAGANGGIAYFRNNEVKTLNMPKSLDDFIELLQYLQSISHPVVFIEKLSMRPDDVRMDGKGANLGKMFRIKKMISNYEQLKAAIVCCHLDFAEVHPLTWQSRLGLRLKGLEKAERKREYKCVAQALYPGTTPTLKTADAILIMHFGRKIFDDKKWLNKNLNQAKRNLL